MYDTLKYLETTKQQSLNRHIQKSSQTVRLVLEFLCDWLRAKQIFQETTSNNSVDSSCNEWHKPARSFVKCNVDDTLFPSEQKVDLGCVLRDDNGMFLSCRMCVVVGMVGVKEGEAIGLLGFEDWVRRSVFRT